MPTNITIVMPPMMASVAAALSALGLRKLGTPLLTASTPVSAVQPEANARSASRGPDPGDLVLGVMAERSADSGDRPSPVSARHRPTANISVDARDEAVGGDREERARTP